VSSRPATAGARQSTRFFTAVRLPAAAVVFFAGRCETYRTSLYRTHGRVWVATLLADTMGNQRSTDLGEVLATAATELSLTSGAGSGTVPTRLSVSRLQTANSMGFRARSCLTSSVDSAGELVEQERGGESASKRPRCDSFVWSSPHGRNVRSGSLGDFFNSRPQHANSTPKQTAADKAPVPGASEQRRPRSSSLGGESAEKKERDM